MRLLVVSNSYSFGQGYLTHVLDEAHNFFKNVSTILFFPFALHDYEEYTNFVRNRLKPLGFEVISIHSQHDPKEAIKRAEAFFVGGGNTFRLLKSLYEGELLNLLSQRILDGTPYMGSSAGANIISPTIKTTNDMPIVWPPSLDALSIIPFQINPHYFDPDPGYQNMIESREKRIAEYHEENDLTVLGIRENSFLRVEGNTAFLKGKTNGRLFIKGWLPEEIVPVADISYLLSPK